MRLAVIGLGFMGRVHLQALRDLPEIEVCVVGNLRGSAGNLAIEGDPVDISQFRKFPDIASAMSDSGIDAVDICLPSHLHESAAIEALRRGKHVLVEKPMALDPDACERMLGTARAGSKILMIAQVLRFFPAYRALEAALPEAGEIRSATFRRRCARPTWAAWQSDYALSGGAILDLLIHDLDMALHLFGAPQSVRATGTLDPANAIDLLSAQLFYDGFAVDVVGGWHPGKFPLTMKYRVVGSAGSIDYDLNSAPPRIHRGAASEDLRLSSTGGYTGEIGYFAECVRSGAAPALCPPAESARAVRLARILDEARARNGETIACNLE